MELPDTRDWWTNRRRHSYMSLIGLFGLALLGAFAPESQLAVSLPLFQTLAYIFGAVILTYVTAATVEDIVKLRGLKP
jgi:peptidoglycan/LPS O-acetylase OafA/YrhL